MTELIVTFSSFVFWKVIAGIPLIVIWTWPPALLFLYWVETTPWVGRFWRLFNTSVLTLGVLGTITYWNEMVPAPIVSPNQARGAADAIYDVTFRSWDEHRKKVVAANSVVRTDLGTVLRRYRLDDWTPPKHFYVDLTDVETGEKIERLYVSKHCNASSSLKRGEEYNISVNRYTLSNEPNRVHYEFTNLYGTFC